MPPKKLIIDTDPGIGTCFPLSTNKCAVHASCLFWLLSLTRLVPSVCFLEHWFSDLGKFHSFIPPADDAIAILAAFNCPDKVQIVGMTTIYGNVPTSKATQNAVRLRELTGEEQVAPVITLRNVFDNLNISLGKCRSRFP